MVELTGKIVNSKERSQVWNMARGNRPCAQRFEETMIEANVTQNYELLES